MEDFMAQTQIILVTEKGNSQHLGVIPSNLTRTSKNGRTSEQNAVMGKYNDPYSEIGKHLRKLTNNSSHSVDCLDKIELRVVSISSDDQTTNLRVRQYEQEYNTKFKMRKNFATKTQTAKVKQGKGQVSCLSDGKVYNTVDEFGREVFGTSPRVSRNIFKSSPSDPIKPDYKVVTIGNKTVVAKIL